METKKTSIINQESFVLYKLKVNTISKGPLSAFAMTSI